MPPVKTVYDVATGQTTVVPLEQSEIDSLLVGQQMYEEQQLVIHGERKVDIQAIINFINNADTLAKMRTILVALAKQVYRLKYGMSDQEIDAIIAEP